MKKLVIGMLAVVISFSATAQGQQKNKKDMGEFKKEKFERKQVDQGNMRTSKLNLTDDQRTKMKSLNENLRDRLKELKKNENITVKEQRERREALMTEHKANVEAILTPEQRQQLENQKKNHPSTKAGRGERLDDLQTRLNLTDNQGQKIKAVNQEFKTKVQAIQKNSQLTSAQKKEQTEALQKQHTEDIKAVLTAEQKDKLESLKKNRSSRRNAK